MTNLFTQTLNEEEQKLFRLYGKLPNKKDILHKKLEVRIPDIVPCASLTVKPLQERKYFDSGDYALSKAGKASEGGVTNIGSQHPLPENIPHHLSSPTHSSTGGINVSTGGAGLHLPGGPSQSPVKENSFLHRQASIEEQERLSKVASEKASTSPPPVKQGVPLRWQN